METIIITPRRQKTELLILAICVLFAIVLNMIAIILYQTNWTELWTQSVWTLFIGAFFYGITLLLRLSYWGIRRLIVKK